MQYKSQIVDFILYKNGTDGTDGTTPYVHIKYSDDGGTTFTANNGETTGEYLGIYVDFIEADSSAPGDYKWSKIKGEQGIQGLQGEQGIQGEKGEDGKTTYFHIKYSAIENPTSSDQLSETPDIYIGTYVDYTEADSTDPSVYTWCRLQGIQGEQGIAGQNGENGQTSYLHIKYSNDGGSTFTANNGEIVGDYIGQCVNFTEADPTDVVSYKWSKIKGDQGIQGTGGLSYRIESSLGTSFLEDQTDITTLTARIYQGNDEIDADGELGYGWLVVSHDRTQTVIADLAIGNKSIEISAETIAGKSVYFVAGDPDAEGSDDGTGKLSAPVIYLTDVEGDADILSSYRSPTFDFILYKNGENGTSMTIKGSYESEDALNAAHPTGNIGDGYLIKGELYTWNGSAWENVGNIQGPQGETGTGVDSITTEFYLSTSKTTQTGGEWATTMPEWSVGKYLWTRHKIVYKDPTSTVYTEPQCDSSWEVANAVEQRVIEAETQINQNKEQIELRAVKTEVEEKFGDYYTKEEADSALTVKANEITSSVQETYATKADVETRFSDQQTKINQNAENIELRATKTEMSETFGNYYTKTEANALLSVQSEQITMKFESAEKQIDSVDDDLQTWKTQYNKHITFSGDNAITIGSANSSITLEIDNDNGIVFKKNGVQFGWWDGTDFHTGNIVVDVNERAQFGNFAFVPRTDGSLMFLKVGDRAATLSKPVIYVEESD